MRFPSSRRFGFGALLAGLAVAGCGGDGPRGEGAATFAWYVFDIEDTSYATALLCEQVGAATVDVTLTDVHNLSAVYITQGLPCAAGLATTVTVPAGSYYAGFDLYGDPQIYGNATTRLDGFDATDDLGEYAIFRVGPGIDSDFTASYAPFVVQSFTVSWGIAVQSAPTTCAAAGATHVYLDFLTVDPVPGGTAGWVSSPFACDAGAGVSYAIPYGPTTAQWSLALVDAAGNDLQVLPGAAVALPATSNVNLGPQTFRF